MENPKSQYASLSSKICLEKLSSSLDLGLTSSEATTRLSKFGMNALSEKKASLFMKLFKFFWGPIPWMIEIAALISGLLERWPDFILITALLLINTLLGFFHEFQADSAIAALKKKLALKTRVKRDGTWTDLAAINLVPGDIVSIKLGNIVPADIKLISGEYLSVDESALTGESLPSDKKIDDQIFSGTIVKQGEMTGIVTETGMNTFFGQTAKLIESAKTVSHFQQAVLNIGRFLIICTLSIAAIILLDFVYKLETVENLHIHFGQIAIFLLVLVVAGIPVALPAVTSVTMSIGASKMAKLKAIVSKLMAIEELSGMSILCSDKTGTLTQNKLTIGKTFSLKESEESDILLYASLASNHDSPDAIDAAIIDANKEKDLLNGYKTTHFTPFDPVSKRCETALEKNGQAIKVSKGAPQVIVDLCHLNDQQKNDLNKEIDQFAKKGFRTLGVAKTDDGTNWNFLGLISLFDPPREDTKETIAKTKEMGISVKMVTGDHLSIAKEMASQVGLGSKIINASEIKTMTTPLIDADGFSEVFPEHKFQIVKEFQKEHLVTGMTGDGVNYAPALKQADIGIAVSGATDAARAAADLVLTRPGLHVITEAITEARRIFGRLKSYAIYRVSETCRLLFFLLFSILAFDQKPLSAIMIILIALLNDIPIMTIAYDHMEVSKTPTKWSMKEVVIVAIGLAIVGVISTFGLYWIGKNIWLLPQNQCSTLAFMGILCGGNLTIYLTRNQTGVFSKPLPQKTFFLATLFSQIVGTLISIYGLPKADFTGIGWKYASLSWAYITVWFLICYLVKRLLYWILKDMHMKSGYVDKVS